MSASFLHSLMNPKSIAIVGASNNPMKMGTMHALSIIKDGFKGKFYPIHPSEKTVLGLEAFAAPEDLPEAPDLAIFVLPSKYLLGFFVVLYYCRAQIRAGKLKMTEHQLDDLLGKLVIALIIGARLAYAIFYNPSYFLAQPWKILFIWEGGLSFHGGLIAILLTAIWYARKNHLTVFNLADHIIIPLALANAFGRIGNFVNGELYGIPTTQIGRASCRERV